MKIICPTCQKTYNIPDERLPKKDRVSFACPECKGKIVIDIENRRVIVQSAPPKATAEETPADSTASHDEQTGKPLSGDELKKEIVKSFKDLPPMPEVVQKVKDVMEDPTLGFKDVGNVLETDPAFAAGVLKLANSAYYGMSGMVNSVQQAAVVLGYKTLDQLITVMGGLKLLGKSLKGYQMKSGLLWKHSLAVAYGAKKIANDTNPPLESDAFAAGLVHDAGKIVLDPYILERRDLIDKAMSDENISIVDAENKILGFNHADITSELCKKWNFPESQVIAVGFHHDPSQSDKDTLSYIIHLANTLAVKAGFTIDVEAAEEVPIDGDTLDELGLTEADATALMDHMIKTVEDISAEMQVD